MGTTEKLSYLNETKQQLKAYINTFDGNLTDESTFRSYKDELNDIILKSIDGTIDLYTLYPKYTGSSDYANLSGTEQSKIRISLSPKEIAQDGTPTPDVPIEVNTVTGNNTITISNEDNTQSQNYSINLGSIEYAKIGSAEDNIYRDDNGDWYFEEHIGKKILNGTENWVYSTLSNNTITSAFVRGLGGKNLSTYMCNKFPYLTVISAYTTVEYCGTNGDSMRLGVFKSRLNTPDLQGLKSWLSQNNIKVYFELATPTTTQITDSDLIDALDALYDEAMSYKGNTTIIQINDDLPFTLNYSVLKEI